MNEKCVILLISSLLTGANLFGNESALTSIKFVKRP